MAEGYQRGDDATTRLEYLQLDVEKIWQTLKLNREVLRFLDDDGTTEMRGSTDRCSDNTVCTACSSDGCVMTVYH